MLVLIPFFQKEVPLVEKCLEWIFSLDGKTEFDGILFCEEGTDAKCAIEKAKKAFKMVYHVQYGKIPINHWPESPNICFQKAIKMMNKHFAGHPFLWLEPDAIPIRSGWLHDIAQEYHQCGQPIMGNIVDGMGHCNGVAVYAPRMDVLCPEVMRVTNVPWDVAMKAKTIGKTHKANHLFQRVWNVDEGGATNREDAKPATFKTKEDVARLVDFNAAIFHRCKDGSLIDVLRQKETLWQKINPFSTKREGTALVMLGRYGDIANVLPIAKLLHDQGKKPTFIVSKDYKDILEGVSYAQVEVSGGSFANLSDSTSRARKRFLDVRVAQVYGHEYSLPIRCKNFNEEQWRMAGYQEYFGKLPLIFDKRDFKREAALAKKHWNGEKPLVLVNTQGNSSPFKHGEQLNNILRTRLEAKYSILDIGSFKAERIYDLIGLMDRAAAMVTIDTATLHLAAASAVPTVALLSDEKTPWHATKPQCNVVLQTGYKDAMNKVEAMMGAIQKIVAYPSHFIHTFSAHEGVNPETKQRISFSRANNRILYKAGGWIPLPQQDSMVRMMTDQKGILPYAKSLIDNAFSCGRETDVVVLTNTDINFVPSATSRLREKMAKYRAAFAYRVDFSTPFTRQLTDKEAAQGKHYPGSDMFALSFGWWKENRDKFPDMVIGRECWDWCLRELIISTEGKEAMLENIIYHKKHASHWEEGDNKRTLRGNIHNQQLAKVFLPSLGVDLAELKGRV